MKIQICRASGQPIKHEHIEQFNEEYRALYDKVIVHVGLSDNTMITPEKAERAQKLLDRCSKGLRSKYPTIGEIELPKTQKSWLALVAQHGPIAIARHAETGKAALVVMDSDWTA